ncbi:DUF4296 domain-containing protein [Coprobacter fastidiosus]|uniref:DUF4296 domain-containing protein n=1 Tax=Coprobacter fastidiosus TaxID=1099853 RepID=UPI00266E9BF2|nr:DUF4296 domain-containing protein [Coprobacter fastidiosus]
MRSLFYIALCSVILCLFPACDRTPDHIIKPKAMEDLLVDIHKSEAIIEKNYQKYGSIEQKEELRNAVLKKHGVDKALFDSSLMWYGHHLPKYIKIYDNVIARLKEEDEAVKVLIAENNSQPLSRPGDSVNIWPKEQFYVFEPHIGRSILTFDIPADDNYQEKDIFILKLKFNMLPQIHKQYPHVTLAVKHKNDSIRFISSNIRNNGWAAFRVESDSSAINKIYGNIIVPSRPDWIKTYADSISLTRIRYRKSEITRPEITAENDSTATK